MADLKREYVIPLRRKTRSAPRWRRSKKAVSVLKDYVRKHMKTDDVIVCAELNEVIWQNGARNPPGKVSVTALRTEVAGEQRTLVNLATVGVDKQLEKYKAQVAGPAAAAAPKADEKSELEEKVQDAEVKEAPAKEEVKEAKPEEKKAETKKAPAKKEVKAKEEKKNE